jgi:hypothetical protein
MQLGKGTEGSASYCIGTDDTVIGWLCRYCRIACTACGALFGARALDDAAEAEGEAMHATTDKGSDAFRARHSSTDWRPVAGGGTAGEHLPL